MRFAYKAIRPTGHKVYGQLDVRNAIELENRLQAMGLELISSRPLSTSSFLGKRRLARRDMINFCFQLEQLSAAGVPLLEGLSDLRDNARRPKVREAIAGLIEGIEGGLTLSQAMAGQPSIFNRVFVNLVNAGEISGHLPEVLENLSNSLKWEDELAAHTKKLLFYPAFIGAIVLAATFFLMIYLVPQLKLFIKNMGQSLPPQTRLLFFLSDLLATYWFVFLLTPALLLGIGLLILRHNPLARRALDDLKLRLPMLGPVLNKIVLSRFASTLAMLYAAGIPLLESIRSTQLVVGNRAHQQALQQVEQAILAGQGITDAFQAAGIFPPLVVRMLRVGESTGKLDKALLNVSYFYNRDVKDAVARAQTMIEPMLTVVMGLLLGWIMLSVITPIYDVIARVKL